MTVSQIMEKMIRSSSGNINDIEYWLKYSFLFVIQMAQVFVPTWLRYSLTFTFWCLFFRFSYHFLSFFVLLQS